jgi:hypothetical protein
MLADSAKDIMPGLQLKKQNPGMSVRAQTGQMLMQTCLSKGNNQFNKRNKRDKSA